MVPELVTVTSRSMVRVTPEFTVQVSTKDIVASEVIVVSVVNVIEAASASCGNPINPKMKILAIKTKKKIFTELSLPQLILITPFSISH